MVKTFTDEDKTLWYDYSHESLLNTLSRGAICMVQFYEVKFRLFLDFRCVAPLRKKGLRTTKNIKRGTVACFGFKHHDFVPRPLFLPSSSEEGKTLGTG